MEYIELIYDLIFVYLISRNGDLLHTMQGDIIRPMAFLIAAVSIYYLCLLMTQQFSRYAVSSRKRTYLTMGISLFVYAAFTALFYKNAYIGIAFSVAFIYLQLLIMHFGKSKKEGEPKP